MTPNNAEELEHNGCKWSASEIYLGMIATQLQDHSKEWCSNGKPWRPVKAEDYSVYMDSDCLAYKQVPFLTIFPALIEDAIVIRYSRNSWRHTDGDAIDIRYSTTVLRAEALVGSTRYSRSWSCMRLIFDTQQQPCKRKRWLDPLDTQQIVGDAIDTQ